MNRIPDNTGLSSARSSGIIHGHEYVDLGLSVKWAACNVGALSPLDFGQYFAWGEIQPKSEYAWKNYKFWENDSSEDHWCSAVFSKYNTRSNHGIVDNMTRLSLSDDAARAHWGGCWRMPTIEEFNELKENCKWSLCGPNDQNVDYYKVVSRLNGNILLLPIAGYLNEGRERVQLGARTGKLWSSSLVPEYAYEAFCLDFDYSHYYECDCIGCKSFARYYGLPIRPVIL